LAFQNDEQSTAMTERLASIATGYVNFLERLHRVARHCGRDPSKIQLITVTKGHPIEAVQAVIDAGARRLGENYLEEAEVKISALSHKTEVEWHMIGHVQSRKAQPVVEKFSYVHSLDSIKLANRLNKCSFEAQKKRPVLLECNVSSEASKFGFAAWQEEKWETLLPTVEAILALPYLQVNGLMTMAPYFPQPEPARPVFRRLRQLLEYLAHHFQRHGWIELSMGMSGDFEVAVEEGATMLRIGTAIMGERPKTK
jgi:pyridoxal phosphate enzyme (YggS family)